MIVSRFPYPLEKGDKLRAFYQMKELSDSFDITLIALHDDAISEERRSKVKEVCSELITVKLNFVGRLVQLFICLFDNRPFQTGYFYSWRAQRTINKLLKNNQFDHIYCQLVRTTEYVLHHHHTPKTLDYMDALSAGIKRRIDRQPFFKKWLFRSEAKRLTQYERKVFDYFENLTIISKQDRRLISHPDRKKIICIPNGIDDSFFDQIEGGKTHDFVFVGNMSYPPNIEAVTFIVDKILPSFPGSTLLVSGSSPHTSLKKIANENSQVTLTGWVEDIRSSYVRGQIFLAPMMIGTGMQNKLLEAMALSIPCVTTPLANNAIGAENGKEILVGKSETQLIEAIKELREDENKLLSIAKAGSEFVRNNFSWSTSTELLKAILNKDHK